MYCFIGLGTMRGGTGVFGLVLAWDHCLSHLARTRNRSRKFRAGPNRTKTVQGIRPPEHNKICKRPDLPRTARYPRHGPKFLPGWTQVNVRANGRLPLSDELNCSAPQDVTREGLSVLAKSDRATHSSLPTRWSIADPSRFEAVVQTPLCQYGSLLNVQSAH